MSLSKSTFDFLISLSKNNNREWFAEHKNSYLKEHQLVIEFADEVLALMKQHDELETISGKASLHRIYKDTRFSKEKIPYKNNWSASFKRATKSKRGGYYFHLEPGNTFLAGGFFNPNSEDLKRIREDINYNWEEWNEVLSDKGLIKSYGKISGNQVLTAPKGYLKEHPGIELLRLKQFIFKHNFTDKEVFDSNFAQNINETFKNIRPFFDYMSEILTTDSNGISII